MKNEAIILSVDNKKHPNGTDLSPKYRKELQRLKKRFKRDVEGADSQNKTLTYGLFVQMGFMLFEVSHILGINTLLRFRVFWCILWLNMVEPERCYMYSIGRLLGVQDRLVQYNVKWLVDLGYVIRYRGIGTNVIYYRLTDKCVDNILSYIDSVKSAKSGE